MYLCIYVFIYCVKLCLFVFMDVSVYMSMCLFMYLCIYVVVLVSLISNNRSSFYLHIPCMNMIFNINLTLR
jgi:hypothetical protein